MLIIIINIVDGHQQHSSSTFDDANLANDFTRLFATPGGALGGGTGGDNMGMNMINNNLHHTKKVKTPNKIPPTTHSHQSQSKVFNKIYKHKHICMPSLWPEGLSVYDRW